MRFFCRILPTSPVRDIQQKTTNANTITNAISSFPEQTDLIDIQPNSAVNILHSALTCVFIYLSLSFQTGAHGKRYLIFHVKYSILFKYYFHTHFFVIDLAFSQDDKVFVERITTDARIGVCGYFSSLIHIIHLLYSILIISHNFSRVNCFGILARFSCHIGIGF